MLNEKTVTLKMKRIDLCKLQTACLSLKFDFERAAIKAETEDAKRIAEGSANMWSDLHEILRAQLEDFDAKHENE